MPQLPATPPAIIEPVSQSQQQQQEQNQFTSPSIESSNSNNAGSESSSESTNVLNQNGELSNYQINNGVGGSDYGFGIGTTAPVPTISVTSYSHSGSNGVSATLNIPLSGAVGRQHKQLVNSRIRRIDLDNNTIALQGELELATACAKIAASGVEIDFSQFPILARCQYVKVPVKPSISIAPPQIVIPPVQRIVPPASNVPKRPISGLW